MGIRRKTFRMGRFFCQSTLVIDYLLAKEKVHSFKKAHSMF
ncbi:hypothetical protein SRABI84_04237 [Peribacillus simplex]|nr:hypothetical protein SRABI84_04237 [Peribacillus simplex]